MPRPPVVLKSFAELAGFGRLLANQQGTAHFVASNRGIHKPTIGKPWLSISDNVVHLSAAQEFIRSTPLATPRLIVGQPRTAIEELVAAVTDVKGVQDSAILAINSLISRMNHAVTSASNLDAARVAVAAESDAFRSSAIALATAIKGG
jgi:hypothetical protein